MPAPIVAGAAATAIVGGMVADFIYDSIKGDPALAPGELPENPKPTNTTLNEQFNINTVNQYNTTNYNISPPSISPGVKVIYVPTGNKKQPTVNINIKAPPTVPNRRLPKEADGQNATQTPSQKSISVSKAATEMELGGLLHFPISTKEMEIRQAVGPDLGQKVREANEKSAKNFGLWMAQQSGTLTEQEEKDLEAMGGGVPVWDCAALITPQFLSGFEGEIGFLIGLEGLHAIASEFRNQRYNAFLPVTGIIPQKYKITTFTPQNNRTYKEGKAQYNGKAAFITNAGLNGVSSVLGVDEFPISVPRSFVNHTDAELDKILDKKIQLLGQERTRTTDDKLKKAIEAAIEDCEAQKQGKSVYQTLGNIPQQTSWLARVLDEVLGSYPFSITLRDSDLIKVGDQEKTVKVPNIAESLAELQGLGIVNHAATELSLNFLIRILTETGVGRMQTVKNYYLLDVIRDWLGVRTKDKNIDVQFSYDPLFILQDDPNTSDEFAKFLQAKMAPVQIEEIDEQITLRKQWDTIDQIFMLCKTYMTRPVKDADSLVKYIKDAAEALRQDKVKDGDGADDFDNFLRLIEKGGVDLPGNTLDNKPYGRDYDQRPRTNRLTNNGSTP